MGNGKERNRRPGAIEGKEVRAAACLENKNEKTKIKPLAVAIDRTLCARCTLCLGAEPLDPNGLSESQEDRAFVCDRFELSVRFEGGCFPSAVGRAQFLNTL